MLALAPACHKQGNMQREQQNYKVVQEGSTSGASSTLNAPGETAPLVVGTTTSADTTTNFTLPTGQTTSNQPASPGTTPLPSRTDLHPQQRPYFTPSEGRRELQPAPATTTSTTRPPESDQPPTSTTETSANVEPSTTTTSSDTSGEPTKPLKKRDEAPPTPPSLTDTTGTQGQH